MSLELLDSTQFRIKEIVVYTKGGPVIITSIFDELNIFDSLFLPIMSGNILITDSLGLSKRLNFDGSEVIGIDIEKSVNSKIASFKKSFRIYKQSDRKNVNQSTEKYILHFVSDEQMYSDQQRVNQSYQAKYSDVVQKIMTNYLKVPNSERGIYEETSGIKKIVVPNLSPLDAIDWCARRSVDQKNSPSYVFFKNAIGYNFVSLSTLLTKDSILNINFSPKNLSKNDPLSEMSSARSYEVIVQNDSIEKTRSGVNAGKFMGFDPMTRTFGERALTFQSHYSKINHSNKNANATEIVNRDNTSNFTSYDSRKVVSLFGAQRKNSAYIKKYEPESISKIEDYENFAFQRKAIFRNLVSKRLKVVMPGNFQLMSGFNVDFTTTGFSFNESQSEKQDDSISGKYLIVATRQIITTNKHETIIEVATDSTNNTEKFVSNAQQNQAIKGFSK